MYYVVLYCNIHYIVLTGLCMYVFIGEKFAVGSR